MELKERKLLNSLKKLYKKRVKDSPRLQGENQLIEIGYYRCVSTRDSFVPDWSLHTTIKLPDTTTSYIQEVFTHRLVETKESYYLGWLRESDSGELIFDSLEEIYVNCNEVVGFRNIALGWSWYYQDFVDVDKEYY